MGNRDCRGLYHNCHGIRGVKIMRVFPRRTKATPVDDLVRINCQPGLFDTADEIHISVAFTYDLPIAEKLEKQWKHVAPCKIGGPATGEAGGHYVPGMYLKQGYVITSRGCPNRCWFCSVWKREGNIRELSIAEGWNVLDDNLLACSDEHIKKVFYMLQKQKHLVEFTGGLEAKRLTVSMAHRLKDLKPKQLFFAYDTPDDLEPLREAGKQLIEAGFSTASHVLRSYVLCGYPKDTFEQAEKRMFQTIEAGFMPMAMLYRSDTGERDIEWSRWQRNWARPTIIGINRCQPKQHQK